MELTESKVLGARSFRHLQADGSTGKCGWGPATGPRGRASLSRVPALPCCGRRGCAPSPWLSARGLGCFPARLRCPSSSPQDDQGGPEELPPAHLQRARGCRADQGAAWWVPGPGRRSAARCPRGLPALPAALGPGSRPGRHGVSRPLQGSCRSQSQGRAGFGTEQGRGLAPRAAPSSRRPRPVSQAFPLSSTLSPSCPGTPAPCVVGLKAFGLRRGPPRQLCTRGSGSVFSDAAGPSRSPRRGLPSPRTRSEPKAAPFGAHVLSCCRLQADRPVPTCAPPPESGALERSG